MNHKQLRLFIFVGLLVLGCFSCTNLLTTNQPSLLSVLSLITNEVTVNIYEKVMIVAETNQQNSDLSYQYELIEKPQNSGIDLYPKNAVATVLRPNLAGNYLIKCTVSDGSVEIWSTLDIKVVSGNADVGATEDLLVFKKLVGIEAEMDPAIVALVLQKPAGEKYFVDADDDGYVDTIYFVDNDARHGDSKQPLVVKIVDEDGDMYLSNAGDQDSDLYIADWYGDGTIDRIIDYLDLDGDNDVDEQYLYFFKKYGVWGPVSRPWVAWVKDYGDDNKVWYDVNYEYNQLQTQWLSDFNGDEMFAYAFVYDQAADTLIPHFEIAFGFYDQDQDGYAEEVVRFSGDENNVQQIRYSLDIDNDNASSLPYHHDYDFSLSCIGDLTLIAQDTKSVNIRGYLTQPIVDWERMRAVAKAATWDKIHLTWDENDNNIDPRFGQQSYERWEGVINLENKFMPQITPVR